MAAKTRREKEVLSILEAARYLGVSTETLRRYVRAGILPELRTSGGHRRFRMEDLRRLKSAPPDSVALYVHVRPFEKPDEDIINSLTEAAGRSALRVKTTITESTDDLVLPLPERPGFRQLVLLASKREISGFIVDSLRMLGALNIAPWLEVLAALGLVCYDVPQGATKASRFPLFGIEQEGQDGY